MTTPASPYTWTYSEYARFPDDGNRYEVIDGEVLVTPAPTPQHQHVVLSLAMILRPYVERFSLGVVLADVDVLFAAGQFLRPDLVFVPATQRAGISDRGVEVPPGLIVEVESPTSHTIDRVKKPRRYGEFGVQEYPGRPTALVWRCGRASPDQVRPAARPHRPCGPPAQRARRRTAAEQQPNSR